MTAPYARHDRLVARWSSLHATPSGSLRSVLLCVLGPFRHRVMVCRAVTMSGGQAPCVGRGANLRRQRRPPAVQDARSGVNAIMTKPSVRGSVAHT